MNLYLERYLIFFFDYRNLISAMAYLPCNQMAGFTKQYA